MLKYLKLLMIALTLLSCKEQMKTKSEARPVDLVYPYLDAANSRWFFFSSACRPFGMVNLSPDTEIDGAWGSGYRYNIDTIKGFSHIHAWQLSGVSVMPVHFRGENENGVLDDYFSHFKHEEEKAAPGYHQVKLDRYNINAELTSTARVGFHKYTYPLEGNAAVIFNLGGKLGPSEVIEGSFKKVSDDQITGMVVCGPTKRRPKPTPVYFTAMFNRSILNIKGKINDVVTSGIDNLSGTGGRIMLEFGNVEEPLLMKVGISYVNEQQAILNLDSELDHWNFEQIVHASQTEWNRYLSRIKVEGGTEKERRRFYTDLWHALQGRRTISDVDGKYADYTGEEKRIGQIALDEKGKPRHRHFNSDSFWGAQWTLNTLWHLVYPEITEEFVNSMLLYYKDGGLIPRGPSGGNYTYVMTGASSTPFIVSAYQKGIRGFDINLAYEGLKKNHMPGGIMAKAGYEHNTTKGGGLEYYIQNGYVPWPIPEGDFGYHQDGPSLTMEYAYQDWTLAQLAKVLGHYDDYKYFLKRSENYKNVYDPVSGWMRPKDVNGNWKNPYDAYEYNAGFNEANGAQGTWFVPHDLEGLAELMGGEEKAVKKLNDAFIQAEKLGFTSGTSHAQEQHPEYRRIPINYGNQPSIQTAFIFNKLGRPDLTQYWARRIVQKVYSGLSPNVGFNGDEDQGLMGSLAVLMKIGLFQMTGGTEEDPIYEVGSPVFDRVTVRLNQEYYPGDSFVIETVNNSDDNFYIKNASMNGASLIDMNISHSEIVNGGKLILEMSRKIED